MLSGFVLGALHIVLVVIVLILIGLAFRYIFERFIGPLPAQAAQLYLAAVAIIALIMLVRLALGLPGIVYL